MALIKQLSVDGVVGDIYDVEAVHNSEVIQTVLDVLDAPEIRSALLNMYHPIGSYYFTDRNVNPGTFLGGTWSNVEGRVLLGASETYPVNSEGGYADATVVAHSHTASGSSSSAGAHTHTVSGSTAAAGYHNHYSGSMRVDAYGSGKLNAMMGFGYSADHRLTSDGGSHTHSISGSAASSGAHTHGISVAVNTSGESGVGKNMMPYKAAYIWVRTA